MDVRQVIPRDAIPSIEDPAFGADYAWDPTDEVIALDGGPGPARAYPVRILHYHEIVNDVVDGRPVAVTWCPLCGSAIVYDRRVEGRTLEFGVSGKLADDDLVMYDRETGSEWKQSVGWAIAGPHAGATLRVLPSRLVPLERFRRDHPDGLVLQPPGGASEAGGSGPGPEPIGYEVEPYEAYFSADGFGLGAHRGSGSRPWDRDDLDPKEPVLGLTVDGEAVGLSAGRLRAAGGVARLRVGGRAVVAFATDEGLFAYADPGFGFAVDDGTVTGDGTTWDPATGEAADGRTLEALPARRLFAFAWLDDHGADALWTP